MRNTNTAAIASVVQGNTAANGHRVFPEPAVYRNISSTASCTRSYLIGDRQQRIRRSRSYCCGISDLSARLHENVEGVVVDSQGANFCTVIPCQVFPLPSGTIVRP